MAPMYAPGWAHPYGRRPGVWYADGGDDPGPDPADTDPGEPIDDPGADPADNWTPPSREEWEQHQASLKRASAEAANRRKWLKANGIDPKTGQKVEPDEPAPAPVAPKPQDPAAPAAPGVSEADMKRAVDKAVAETQLRAARQQRVFAVGLNEELAKAGWNGTRLGSLMKLLDVDAVDIDDGEISGLAEQIEEIKAEWPELFKRQRANPSKPGVGSGQNGTPAGNVDTGDKKPPPPEPKGWAEQIAERLMRT